MKRIFIALMMVCLAGAGTSNAQEMRRGMSLGNIGLGFFPGVGVNASYDYGLIDEWGPGIFTVGGFMGFSNYAYNTDIRGTRWMFAPRATYRYAIDKMFEVYGAFMLGAYFTAYNGNKTNVSGVAAGLTGGCRYSLKSDLSLFAEVGFNPVSFLNCGLTIAF